jgi:hypothetical protein
LTAALLGLISSFPLPQRPGRHHGHLHQPPPANANAHGAVSFFENEFDSGLLMPGQSFTHTFTTAGEFFYNDPVFPQSTGKIVVS